MTRLNPATCPHARQRWLKMVSTSTPHLMAEFIACADCSHLLTIGPSNDAIPADEMAHAERAAARAS